MPSVCTMNEYNLLKLDVNRDFVWQDLKEQHQKGTLVTHLAMDQIKTTVESANIMDVDFLQNVSFIRHGEPKTITVHSFLKFEKVEGLWKIFYFRQLNT